MSVRLSAVFLILLIVLPVDAKKKQVLPDDVLKAETVWILVFPDTRKQPMDEQSVRSQVEKAMVKWGRFRLVQVPSADLIIVAHEGHVEAMSSISNPADDKKPTRPTGLNPPLDPNTPGLRNPSDLDVERTIRKIKAEEDTFEVYRGGDHPLNAHPVWHYSAKGALYGPKVPAVERFRKAVDESEKQRQQKP